MCYITVLLYYLTAYFTSLNLIFTTFELFFNMRSHTLLQTYALTYYKDRNRHSLTYSLLTYTYTQTHLIHTISTPMFITNELAKGAQHKREIDLRYKHEIDMSYEREINMRYEREIDMSVK